MNAEIRYYLLNFQQQCTEIQLFTQNLTLAEFIIDQRTKNAVAMSFIVLGEMVNKINQINPDFVKTYPSIPWRIMIDFRNKIAHDYYGLDWQIVLTTAQVDIPKVAQQVNQIIEHLSEI